MSEKSDNFALENEPTALSSHSFGFIPTLTGDAAERFIRMAKENEEKAKIINKEPLTIDEAKQRLSHKKIMFEYELNRIKEMENEIKELEIFINSQN